MTNELNEVCASWAAAKITKEFTREWREIVDELEKELANERALHEKSEKRASELLTLLRIGWSVEADPRRNGGFVCGPARLNWPHCVKGEGVTGLAAIEAALQTYRKEKS